MYKPLSIARGLESDPSRCTIIVNGQIKLIHDFMASHKEANDRIMYSINQVFQRKNSETITVVTSDTDIITLLLNHLNNASVGKSVHVLKKRRIVSSKQQYELYPLHRILLQLGRMVINSLSAAHSLTGCDTGESGD